MLKLTILSLKSMKFEQRHIDRVILSFYIYTVSGTSVRASK